MNVWITYLSEDLPLSDDIRKGRCTKMAEALVQRGHSVLWWTTAFDHKKKDWLFPKDTELLIKKGFRIFALKGCGYSNNISLRRYIDHKLVARKFQKYASKMNTPDIIIGSLPYYDITYEAMKFAKRENIPIIVDIRDLWPDEYLNHVSCYVRKPFNVLLRGDYKKKDEVLRSATSIVAMMDDILNRELERVNRERTGMDKVFYLGADRCRNVQETRIVDLKTKYGCEGKLVVTFVGSFGEYYNPRMLIEAAKALQNKDICFLIGGDGKYFNEIKDYGAGLKNVFFIGWLSRNDINEVLSISDVGIVPCNVETIAFPNKAFVYLSAGLPIIFSVDGDLRRIAEAAKIGFYFKPGDVAMLIDLIAKLDNDRSLMENMRNNAQRVFEEMFDSNNLYSEFAAYIETVSDVHKKGLY